MLVSVRVCVGVKVLCEWGVLDVNSESTIGEVFHGINTGQVESHNRFHLPEQYTDSLYFLLKEYDETNSVDDLKGTPSRRLLGNEQFRFMDEAMEANPELTSRQLHGMVTDEHHFQQDNNSQHTSRWAKAYFDEKKVHHSPHQYLPHCHQHQQQPFLWYSLKQYPHTTTSLFNSTPHTATSIFGGTP